MKSVSVPITGRMPKTSLFSHTQETHLPGRPNWPTGQVGSSQIPSTACAVENSCRYWLICPCSSVLRLSGLYASLKCNFPSHKLCIFLYFSRSLQKSVPVTLLLSPKFPFWGDQNSHFDNNSPSLPLIGGIRFRIWGKNHPPKIQISNGS